MAHMSEGPWVEWSGGERPVGTDDLVDIKLRNGHYLRMMMAGALAWSHNGGSSDIESYRVLDFPTIKVVPHQAPMNESSLEQCFEQFVAEFRTGMQALQEQLASIDKGIGDLTTFAALEPSVIRSNVTVIPIKVDDAKADTFDTTGKVRYHFDRFPSAPLGVPHTPSTPKTNLEKESAPEIRSESKAETQSDLRRPAPGSLWRHHSGRLYRVLFLANDVTDPKPGYPVTVVYSGPNGKLWAGELADWHRRMVLEKESAPETHPDSKAETQSELMEPRP